jgi:hypothetical protein
MLGEYDGMLTPDRDARDRPDRRRHCTFADAGDRIYGFMT